MLNTLISNSSQVDSNNNHPSATSLNLLKSKILVRSTNTA